MAGMIFQTRSSIHLCVSGFKLKPLEGTNLNWFGKFLLEGTPGRANTLSRLLFAEWYKNKLNMVCSL